MAKTALEQMKSDGYKVLKNKFPGQCLGCGERVLSGKGWLLSHARFPGTFWLLCLKNHKQCPNNFAFKRSESVGSPDDEQ